MQKTKIVLIAALLVVTLAGCESNGGLKPVSKVQPGVAKEGTLVNEKLLVDTTTALENLPNGLSVSPNSRILKFVIQQPVGNPGARAWREFWVANPEESPKQFLITFTENGSNSASFEIQPFGLQ
ncbi:MAG: hypothetical protein ACWA5Q_00070 [bacterium]